MEEYTESNVDDMSTSKLQEYITKTYEELKAYALIRCGSEQIAEDMLHKTIEYLLTKQKTFNDENHFKSYSKLKIKNEYIDHLRKKGRFDQFRDVDPEGDVAYYEFESSESLLLEHSYINDDHNAKLDFYNAMNKLTTKCKELLTFNGLGYSPDEIAEKLGIPVGTVGSRSTRCLESLRNYYNG